MTPDEYCQEKAAASGSSFYASFLFLPDVKRKAITALYAYCREVDDVVDNCREMSVANTKLHWWRQETERLFQNQPRHPVTRALHKYVETFDLQAEHLLAIIDGMQMDLDKTQYQNFQDLALYCYRVAGVVGLLAASIFGYQKESTREYAKTLGTAFQLTNILRDVREDAQLGRVYIPADELAKFKVSPSALGQNQNSAELRELFAYQAQRAEEYYDRAFALLPPEDRYAQRSGIIMAEIYRSMLRKIIKSNYPILEERVSPLAFAQTLDRLVHGTKREKVSQACSLMSTYPWT